MNWPFGFGIRGYPRAGPNVVKKLHIGFPSGDSGLPDGQQPDGLGFRKFWRNLMKYCFKLKNTKVVFCRNSLCGVQSRKAQVSLY